MSLQDQYNELKHKIDALEELLKLFHKDNKDINSVKTHLTSIKQSLPALGELAKTDLNKTRFEEKFKPINIQIDALLNTARAIATAVFQTIFQDIKAKTTNVALNTPINTWDKLAEKLNQTNSDHNDEIVNILLRTANKIQRAELITTLLHQEDLGKGSEKKLGAYCRNSKSILAKIITGKSLAKQKITTPVSSAANTFMAVFLDKVVINFDPSYGTPCYGKKQNHEKELEKAFTKFLDEIININPFPAFINATLNMVFSDLNERGGDIAEKDKALLLRYLLIAWTINPLIEQAIKSYKPNKQLDENGLEKLECVKLIARHELSQAFMSLVSDKKRDAPFAKLVTKEHLKQFRKTIEVLVPAVAGTTTSSGPNKPGFLKAFFSTSSAPKKSATSSVVSPRNATSTTQKEKDSTDNKPVTRDRSYSQSSPSGKLLLSRGTTHANLKKPTSTDNKNTLQNYFETLFDKDELKATQLIIELATNNKDLAWGIQVLNEASPKGTANGSGGKIATALINGLNDEQLLAVFEQLFKLERTDNWGCADGLLPKLIQQLWNRESCSHFKEFIWTTVFALDTHAAKIHIKPRGSLTLTPDTYKVSDTQDITTLQTNFKKALTTILTPENFPPLMQKILQLGFANLTHRQTNGASFAKDNKILSFILLRFINPIIREIATSLNTRLTTDKQIWFATVIPSMMQTLGSPPLQTKINQLTKGDYDDLKNILRAVTTNPVFKKGLYTAIETNIKTEPNANTAVQPSNTNQTAPQSQPSEQVELNTEECIKKLDLRLDSITNKFQLTAATPLVTLKVDSSGRVKATLSSHTRQRSNTGPEIPWSFYQKLSEEKTEKSKPSIPGTTAAPTLSGPK